MRLFDFVFSEDGARSIMNGPKGITWDYDENGAAVFTEDCKQKMKENPDYLLEQGANRYLGLVGQDYDALAVSEANKGDYIDIRLNKELSLIHIFSYRSIPWKSRNSSLMDKSLRLSRLPMGLKLLFLSFSCTKAAESRISP